MIKCPICGKEYEKKRQLHGHMLKAHQEEYKKAGNRVDNIINQREGGKDDRPEGFRLLDKSDRFEAQAYKQGYRYTDGEYVYSSDEVKIKGWI